MIKNIITILFFMIFHLLAYAQEKGGLKGRISDHEHKPIPYATVAAYNIADSSLIDFRMSNDNGDFKLPNLPITVKINLVITCVGKRTFRKEFEIRKDDLQMDLGDVILDDKSNDMDEIKIIAETPPVVVRKDTIEFNSASFRTLPAAIVEDLLKKLPGVQIDRQGNIKYRGRTIQKILVDSKTFFGGNITIATRNLPADIIDKVQILNDKDDITQDPTLPKNAIPLVINLKLKKAVKRGLFGKIYGGAGTEKRYESGGIVNTFRDTLQLSVLAYTNNLNKAGFDIGELEENGGFNRSEIGNVLKTPLNPNGLDFGGNGPGIQTSTGTGANFNTVLGKETELNLRYFYGRTSNRVELLTNNRQVINDTLLNTINEDNGNNLNQVHSVGGKLKGKVGNQFYYTFEPAVSFKLTNGNTVSQNNSSSNFSQKINESENRQRADNHTAAYSSGFSAAYIFQKPGRRISLNNDLNIGVNTGEFYGDANNRFFNPDSVSLIQQLRKMDNHGIATHTVVKFYEPANKDLLLGITADVNYFKETDELLTFYPDANNLYIIPKAELSNTLERNGWKTLLTFGAKQTFNKVTVTPSLRLYSINFRNSYTTGLQVPQDFLFVLPELAIEWKDIYFDYKVSAKEPDGQYLQPVTNNTNPLYQINNNIALIPEITHRAYANYNHYNAEKEMNTAIALSGNYYRNTIIQSRYVNNLGVQVITPVNVSGNWDVLSGLSLGKDYRSGSRKLSVGFSATAQYQRNVLLINHQSGKADIWNLKPELLASVNIGEQLEATETYSLNYYTSHFNLPGSTNFNILTHTSSTDITYYATQNLGIQNQVTYNYNANVPAGIQKSTLRWDAGITYSFIHGKQMVARFAVNDLLNQSTNTVRTIAENFIEDKQVNTLRRYFLFTLTYNIRDFKQRKPDKDPLLRF